MTINDRLSADIAWAAVNGSPGAALCLDRAGLIVHANPAALELMDARPDQVIGRMLTDIFSGLPWPPDENSTSGQSLRASLSRVGDSGQVTVEIRITPCQTQAGERLFWLHARDVAARGITLRDVLNRTRAEEELRQGEKIFRRVFEDAEVGMAIWGDDGFLEEVNSCLCRLLGYTEDELKKIHYLDLTHPEDKDLSLRHDRRIFSGEISFISHEKRYLRKDGTPIWFLASDSLVRDEEGRPQHTVTHFQDITQRKAAEEALQEKERQLQAQTESLEQTNTALKVLLDHREQERINLEKGMLSSLEKLVIPYLQEARKATNRQECDTYLDISLSNLKEVAGPFASHLSSPQAVLSPVEMKVADLIRHGKTSDEVAELLTISIHTVARHREAIRRKLGLTNRKVNLTAYLQSLS